MTVSQISQRLCFICHNLKSMRDLVLHCVNTADEGYLDHSNITDKRYLIVFKQIGLKPSISVWALILSLHCCQDATRLINFLKRKLSVSLLFACLCFGVALCYKGKKEKFNQGFSYCIIVKCVAGTVQQILISSRTSWSKNWTLPLTDNKKYGFNGILTPSILLLEECTTYYKNVIFYLDKGLFHM